MSEEWKYDEQSGSFRASGTSNEHERQTDSYRYTPNRSIKSSDNDWLSWVIIGLLFVSGWGWWIGLILLINKLKDDKRRPTQRSYTTTRTTTTTTTTSNNSTVTQQERTSGVRRTPQRTVTRETTTKVTSAAQRVIA